MNGPLLAPGYGEQGGGPSRHPADLRGSRADTSCASSSRGVLRLGPDRAAMTDAVRRANDELAAAVG